MNAKFWDCDEGRERLIHTEPYEAIEYHLDDMHPVSVEDMPDEIKVYGFAPMKVAIEDWKESVLDGLLERLDENHGNPDDYTEPTDAMLKAEAVFLSSVLSEYVVWNCELCEEKTIVVRDWIQEHRPDWLASK